MTVSDTNWRPNETGGAPLETVVDRRSCLAARSHTCDDVWHQTVVLDAERLELGVYVSSWSARHPEAETKFVG